MPVYSMTGYAGATASPDTLIDGVATDDSDSSAGTPPAGSISVELRSVNSRFLDLVLRLPDEFRSLEPALREALSSKFRRGKIELRLNVQGQSDQGLAPPQPAQLHRLAYLEGLVHNWMPKAAPMSVSEALTWCRQLTPPLKADDCALRAAASAIDGLVEARAREGQRLSSILKDRVDHLRKLADQAEPLIPDTVSKQQAKFIERWQSALELVDAKASVSMEALQERAISEAAAFAIRIDVAEELARLRAHLDEILRMLKKGGEVGKRLDFLIQELLREANTLASKASTLELTNVAVDMKVTIEQLREQVQNLE